MESIGINLTHRIHATPLISAVLALFAATVSTSGEHTAWNEQWKQRVELDVRETAGFSRTNEPVEVELELTMSGREQDLEAAVRREIRVARRAADTQKYEEIPSQAHDIRIMGEGGAAAKARVTFFATVEAGSNASYFVFYDNPAAAPPAYSTPLRVEGEHVAYTIDNRHYRIITAPGHGQIDQIDLKFAAEPSLRFKHGALHWNPDFIVAPEDYPETHYTWYYAHNFDDPEYEVESGPVFFAVNRRQLIPGQEVVHMEVNYRFYAGLPYFIMESLIEAKKDTRTFAIRNDELAFGSEDFTHIGWRDRSEEMYDWDLGSIGAAPVRHAVRVSNHILGRVLPPNMPWISFIHPRKGYGVGSIRLEWENMNLLSGEPSPIYQSRTVVSEHGGGLYWFRSLVYSSNRRQERFLVDIPAGSSYREKNAYMLYESNQDNPFAPIDNLYRRLREPLRVTIVE